MGFNLTPGPFPEREGELLLQSWSSLTVVGAFSLPVPRIARGQYVQPGIVQRAKEMRRAMTPEEASLWQYLRRSQLNSLHFCRPQVIDGFIVDFYCHAAGLIFEVDGRGDEGQPDYDAERDRILVGLGLSVLRIPNSDVRSDLEVVLSRIEDAAKSRMNGSFPLPFQGRGPGG
jgi:very-short-patch-repair endonuclease